MKIGDKVRFLNDVGGGVVSSIGKKGMITVRDDDGFDIPTLASEVVVVNTNEYNIEKKPSGASTGKASKADTPAKTRASLSDADDEEDYDPADRPVTYKPLQRERSEGEKLNVKLAFVPVDIANLDNTTFEAYLINDSNYFLDFCYLSAEGQSWKSRFHGTAEPNTKLFIEEFGRDKLQELARVCVELFAYKTDKPFALKPAAAVTVRIEGQKFYRANCFGESDFFNEPALLYDIVRDDQAVRTVFVDAGEVKEALIEKKRADMPRPAAKPAKKQNDNEPTIVDLHASELLETTRGMKNGEILEYQLDVFRKSMNEHIKEKDHKLIFIHGKGEGVLRMAIIRELKAKFPNCTYQDASFMEYGFGATEVIVH